MDFTCEQSNSTCSLCIGEVVKRIISLNRGLRDFWCASHGWAPHKAAHLLSKSRLDWQVSLSETLSLWLSIDAAEMTDGQLILAWANLGSLVEGTMKLFLAVFYQDYVGDVNALKKNGALLAPDILMLEQLRQFFIKNQLLSKLWTDYVALVQARRNAIHAFKNKEIGTPQEFQQAVRSYLLFVREINARLPYPDDVFRPHE